MKLTIITATYNSEETIGDSITSVYNQTFQDIEHIIIDGASSDRTIKIINALPNRVSNIISEPDKGIYDAINKGLKIAKGDIIGLVHSNDQLANKNVISNIIDLFNTTHCDIIYSNTECFLPSNPNRIVRIDRGGEFKRVRFLKGWMPSHPTVYCRRAVFDKMGLYRLDFKIAADYEFLLRTMYINDFKIQYMDSITYRYALGGISSKNLSNIILSNLECKKAWIINNIKPPRGLILYKLLRKIPQFLNSINNKT